MQLATPCLSAAPQQFRCGVREKREETAMSDRTSHRRRARQNRSKQARAGIVVDSTPVAAAPVRGLCDLLNIFGHPCPKVGNHLYVNDDGDVVVMCDAHHDDEGALLREHGGYAEDLLGLR